MQQPSGAEQPPAAKVMLVDGKQQPSEALESPATETTTSEAQITRESSTRCGHAPVEDGFFAYMRKTTQDNCNARDAPRWFEHRWFKKLDSPWVYRPIALLLAMAPFVAALGNVLHIYYGCSAVSHAGEEIINATWVHSDKVKGLTAMGIFAFLLTNVALFHGLRIVVRGASTNPPPSEPEGRCIINCVSRKRRDDYQRVNQEKEREVIERKVLERLRDKDDITTIRDCEELYGPWLGYLTPTHLIAIATAAGVSKQQLKNAEGSDYSRDDYKRAVKELILERTYDDRDLRKKHENVFTHDILVNQIREDFGQRYSLRTTGSSSGLDLSGKSVSEFIVERKESKTNPCESVTKEDKSKVNDNRDLSKKLKLVELLEKARGCVSDWELQAADEAEYKEEQDHKGAVIALIEEATSCGAHGPFTTIAFHCGAKQIGRRTWLTSEKFDALHRSAKWHVALFVTLVSTALSLLWILYRFLTARDRPTEKWQDSTIYMVFLPANGCLDDESDTLLATMLIAVVVPASLFASCVIPLWMLSLELGVNLVMADLCDCMDRLDPTLVNQLLNGKEGSAESGAAVFRKSIHMPCVKMIIQLEQLSIWGPSMGSTLVGFTLASIGFVPLAVDSRGHTADTTQMVLVVVCTVLLFVPLWVLSKPAYVSTQCGTMLEQLNDMSFFGDKYHKERCHMLFKSLKRANRGHGLGFTVFGVVVDMNKLYKLATALVGLSTMITRLVEVGQGEE
eukprot:COSAG02_NODE_2934_length_7705_cov_11.991191_7_plen_737_part_00